MQGKSSEYMWPLITTGAEGLAVPSHGVTALNAGFCVSALSLHDLGQCELTREN